MTNPETLSDFVNQMDDAVHDLTSPRHEVVQGHIVSELSLLDEIAESVHGAYNAVDSRKAFKSTAPLWVSGLDWIREVELTVRGWLPQEPGDTLDLLRALPKQKWTPAQADAVDEIVRTIRRWIRSAKRLLSTESEMEFRQPCPTCGERYRYRHEAGEDIKMPVVTVTTTEVVCSACDSEWTPRFFARLVGVDMDETLSQQQ